MDLIEVPKTSFRRHPWEVARSRFFRQVLTRAGALAQRPAVLDVGAGDGYLAATLLEQMPQGSRVICFDPHYTDEQLARFASSSTPALAFSRTRPAQLFDIVLLLDVVEHVEDDREFLAGLVAENVTDGGVVLVSVPAWQPLFTTHDVALKHFRRYSPLGIRHLLEQANLTITKCGGLFHGPLVPRTLMALYESVARRMGRAVQPAPHLGQWSAGPLLSAVVEGILFVDNSLSNKMADLGWSFPGLSFWALCRKASP